jgi:hypothetical protein
MTCKLLGVQDLPEIKRVFLDKDVFADIVDDTFKEVKDFEERLVSLVCNQANFFLCPGPGCIFMLSPFSLGSYIVHTCILKELRGRKAFILGKEAINYCFNTLNINKLISYVPSYNRKALLYALLCRFKKEGLLTKSFQLNNQLFDVTIVGLTKEDWLCQQQQSPEA